MLESSPGNFGRTSSELHAGSGVLSYDSVISRCYLEDLNLQLLDFQSELYPKLGTTLKVVSTSVRYELRHQNRNDGAKGSGMPG